MKKPMLDDENKMLQLGRLIERARREKRLQTKQLAEYAGISSSELNRVESGESWPSEEAWERLATFFGLPVDMMSAMKKARRPVPPSNTIPHPPKQEVVSAPNVIDFVAHRKRKWQQMSLFEKD